MRCGGSLGLAKLVPPGVAFEPSPRRAAAVCSGAVNRIRLLPEQVANQIAAGEVVERPASVVKELVENALDAEAGRITVEIGAGGRSLIRVTDDGFGMSRDDALLCLERHATSKIRRAEDLTAIATMGFRGEALPSIASVSRFSLTTRERGDTSGEGSQVLIQGGKILQVKAAASAEGTSVEVRQLFFNLPARRKFLRSEETERAHIAHYLILVALAYPQVGLVFLSDGRPVWQLPPLRWQTAAERFSALRERMLHWTGRDVPLLPVDFTAPLEAGPDLDSLGEPEPADLLELQDAPPPAPEPAESGPSRFRLWGFIGAPGVSRSSREEQHLFVNQRPVENRGLNFALLEGYHTALMKGRYPVCCLFLEVDPAAVDVNVHPQKREVKFRQEAAIRRWTAQAVREALLQFHAPAPTVAVPPPTRESERTAAPVPSLASSPAGFRLEPPPVSAPAATQSALPLSLKPDLRGPVPSAPAPPPERVEATPPSSPPLADRAPMPSATPLLRVPLRLVGVVGRLYVVLESDRGLVLLDQHAAHERVLFEQMLARLEKDAQAPSQRLLLPETLELPPKDADFVRRNLETLSRLGVGLSEFGERTFLLDALPPFVKVGDFRQFTTGLVDALKAAGTGVNNARLGEDVVAKTVCRHAVKARDPLGLQELEALVADLRHCEMPYTCPHGRPTLIE
ncbi:MAG: DNA mismatch repair endonuclease MutL, partial [Verrucomicrobiae bacterium]|nr:DNA mismatch repair endonuclease MutL [Verrucomicrobiae bacterium]